MTDCKSVTLFARPRSAWKLQSIYFDWKTRASYLLIKLNKAETKNVHNARPNKRNFLLKRGSDSSSKERTNETSDRTGKRANNCSIRESKLPLFLSLSQRQTLKRAIFTGYWSIVDGEKSADSRGNGNQLTPATHTHTHTHTCTHRTDRKTLAGCSRTNSEPPWVEDNSQRATSKVSKKVVHPPLSASPSHGRPS